MTRPQKKTDAAARRRGDTAKETEPVPRRCTALSRHHVPVSPRRRVAASFFSLCLCISVFFFLLTGLSFAQGVESYVGKPITAIRVLAEGGQPNESEELRALLRVREGAAYAMADIRRSLLVLYESGRVSNARVETQASANGTVAVTFVVTPQVRVGEILFKGLAEGEEEELRVRLTDLERGAKFSDTVMQRGAEQLYEAMRDRGYYQVSVEPQVTYDATRTLAAITYSIAPGNRATIADIKFTGAPKLAETTLRAEMLSRAGTAFSQTQLNSDVQKLLALHLAENYLDAKIGPAELSYDNATNKVALNLLVNSGPKFTIKPDGYEFNDKKLRQLLPLLREGGVNAASLEESARRLRENLQEEGFFFAEVTPPDVPDLTAEKAELVFKIEPNQRYRVTEIQIKGTDNLTYEEIAADLRSQTESFIPIPILTRYTRGITSEQALRRDVEVLLARLRDLGFRKARRVSINRAVNPENDKLKIIFTLEEGPRSFINDIVFKGNTLVETDKLRAQLNLNPGAPYSFTEVKTEGNKLLQYYFDRGYATATVSARVSELASDSGGDRVRVTYEITEGPLVFINRVIVNNLGLRRRALPERVKNYLYFADGERLSNEKLARSEQELYATGAFRSLRMRTEPLGEESLTGDVRRNVFVDLEEGKSRVIVYGAGYQSDEGARGIFEISDPNIFGRLATASFRLRASPRNILGQIAYTDPRPLGYNTPMLVSLLGQRQVRPAFTSRRLTALWQLEKRLDDRTLMLFRYNYEAVRVTNAEAVLDRRDLPVRLSRVSASYAFDGRDNPFDARTGRYNTVDFTFAARALGGNEQFLRLFTENQFHYTVPRSGGTVLATDVRLGLARNIGLRADLPPDLTEIEKALLPITERFFSGGSTTLRGFGFEEAGPRSYQEVTNVDGTKTITSRPRGGNALIVVNAEIRRNVWRQFGLVGFYDTGNVFSRVSDINFNNLSHTVGLGIRVKTPLGPVRIDAGYLASDPYNGTGLTPTQSANVRIPRWRVHISFGQAF